MNQDGFQVFKYLVFGLSSQLGDISADPQTILNDFKFFDGEKLSEFHTRDQEIIITITLQNDTKGKVNLMTGKYLELL